MVRNWRKAIVFLLLAWVFLDVAVPGVCSADGFSTPGSQMG
jgi:hypothetical protein